MRNTLILPIALLCLPLDAQTCTGPKTGLPTIGQITNPAASSSPIAVNYNGSFKVTRSGVYTIQGFVTLGRGAGSLADFTKVTAVVNSKTVLDEDPPIIQGSPPNGWTYHWSIYYWHIRKNFAIRQFLVANQPYTFGVTAKGYNRVITQWHRRNYGVTMGGHAIYCGPTASVKHVGTGCVGTNAPTIAAPKPPVLGQRRDLVIQGRANTRGLVAFGLPAATPVYLGAGCNVYVDLAAYLPIGFTTNGSGAAYILFNVPNNPALASVRIMTQGVVHNGASPVGFDLTKGLQLTLGY